jgi:hypothetical protein
MSVRLLHDEQEHQAVFYCSTTGWAFGPIAQDCDCGLSAVGLLAAFQMHAESEGVGDLRRLSEIDLEQLWGDFITDQHQHAEAVAS